MDTCPKCSLPVGPGQRFCPACGSLLAAPDPDDSLSDATIDAPPPGYSPSRPAHSDSDSEQFAPGQLLLDRYRIVSFVGRGGMGVVYRADDLKLGQAVALKFLPVEASHDEVWLQRLYQEVRIARQVSHANVCRVYDIGELEGRHFISMEYIEGEDLTSLLRRIGRLPADKALQIARQLCAGVAAAHGRKVVHRDLKPANVMLDADGHVRITDFGLALPGEEAAAQRELSGTPAYMAPEQLSRGESSEASDIYALGLVLYEVFTGKKVYESGSMAELRKAQEESSPRPPSSIVDGLDPAVEAVIMRCLEHDPRQRPASALAVAAALPGGDPLAAALAAGTTPSPELVAAAGAIGGLSARVGALILGAIAVALGAGVAFSPRVGILDAVPAGKSPAVLEEKAREIVAGLGVGGEVADSAVRFDIDRSYLDHVSETDTSTGRWARLAKGAIPVLRFTRRTSPRPMVPDGGAARVSLNNPPLTRPGMTSVTLDTTGRLIALTAVPAGVVEDPNDRATVDWSPLLAAAGLDATDLQPTTPSWTPPVYCDARAAWTGKWPDGTELRVEAGAFRGTPVHLTLISPWTTPPGGTAETNQTRAFQVVIVLVLLGILAIAGLIARRNLLAGRGDRRGSMRLALAVFAVTSAGFVLQGHHVGAIQEVGVIVNLFMVASANAVITWVLYVALEPYARKYWPHSLISWTRLLAGSFRDPLVGRDVLFGGAAAVAFYLAQRLSFLAPVWFGAPPAAPDVPPTTILLGGRWTLAVNVPSAGAIASALGFFLVLLLARIVLRKPWLAIATTLVLFLLTFTSGFSQPIGEIVFNIVAAVLVVSLLVRFGLLAMLAFSIQAGWLLAAPTTLDLSAWYAWPGLLGPLLFVAAVVLSYRVAVAGRRLLPTEL